MWMCRRERMRVVSRVGVLEGLSSGLVPGVNRVVMLECVMEWGVPVRLITMGTMSTCVPSYCEWISFARGVQFSMMRWWVSLRLSFMEYFHSPI
jgi:hypothetical protein